MQLNLILMQHGYCGREKFHIFFASSSIQKVFLEKKEEFFKEFFKALIFNKL